VTPDISASCCILFSGIYFSPRHNFISVTVTRNTHYVFRYESVIVRRVSKVVIDLVQLSDT
jgi:hypothetical protein